jgi:branched-chain amino acid transport system substrate-binding protein
MEQEGGKAMRQGAELYRDQINHQGGIDGKRLEILFRDDKNDPEQAKRIAHTLAQENKVLAVLGHYYDATSKAAGKIYKKNGIPVITASASVESVIRNNKWYFRSIPGSIAEAEFVAAYLPKFLECYQNKSLVKKQSQLPRASIIFSNDDYGISLAEHFEKAADRFGIALRGRWKWDYNQPAAVQLETIKKELLAVDDPGVIYVATHAEEGVQIITSLKDAGQIYPIVISAALNRNFFNKLKSYVKEWEEPGYYSDNIHFVSPFMLTLSGVEGFRFSQAFFEKYQKEPGPVSAGYYDATHFFTQAMKKSNIRGKKHIRQDRRAIREALEGFYNQDNALKGITGLLWFDKTGGVKRGYAVGKWQDQKVTPAFLQYDQHIGNIGNILEGYLDGKVILTDDLIMSSTQIVHIGVEQFKLININKKYSEFTASFQLIFSYPASFDNVPHSSVLFPLEFSNALTSVTSSKPIKEEVHHGVITKVFQITGRFSSDFKSDSVWPFNTHQELMIHFHHTQQQYNNLIYLPQKSNISVTETPEGYTVPKVLCYSDILSKRTTLGIPEYFKSDHRINYSRFNIKIHINEHKK